MLLSLQQATLSSEDQTESSGQNRKDDQVLSGKFDYHDSQEGRDPV